MPNQDLCRGATSSDSDSDALADILYRSFRDVALLNGFAPDFESFNEAVAEVAATFATPFAEGIVYEDRGGIAGFGFLWRTGEVIGIGPVCVAPERQRQGIGEAVMRSLLARAGEVPSIRLLQATYNATSLTLYTKLGFAVEEALLCMRGTPPPGDYGCSVRKATQDDLDAANKVCQNVNGFRRSLELALATEQGAARVVERGGRIVGYTTQVGFYGHSVAIDNRAMGALISDAGEIAGPGIFVPARNDELCQWLSDHGFTVTQFMAVMALGGYQGPQGAYLPNVLF